MHSSPVWSAPQLQERPLRLDQQNSLAATSGTTNTICCLNLGWMTPCPATTGRSGWLCLLLPAPRPSEVLCTGFGA